LIEAENEALMSWEWNFDELRMKLWWAENEALMSQLRMRRWWASCEADEPAVKLRSQDVYTHLGVSLLTVSHEDLDLKPTFGRP